MPRTAVGLERQPSCGQNLLNPAGLGGLRVMPGTAICLLCGQPRSIGVNWAAMGSIPGPEMDQRLSAILSICRRMNSERDLGALLDLIAREATPLLACDRASI